MWQKLKPEQALIDIEGLGMRTISSRVVTARLELPPLASSTRKAWTAQWRERRTCPGGIDDLHWPLKGTLDATHSAAVSWLKQEGFRSFGGGVQLLGCAGSPFHHDAAFFKNVVFCVVWLSKDTPWDIYFPNLGQRIPLERGTAVLFDGAQPHGVVKRGCAVYEEAAFDESPGFFTSLDIDADALVRRLMGIRKLSSRGRRGHIGVGGRPRRHVWADEVDVATGDWRVKPPPPAERPLHR